VGAAVGARSHLLPGLVSQNRVRLYQRFRPRFMSGAALFCRVAEQRGANCVPLTSGERSGALSGGGGVVRHLVLCG